MLTLFAISNKANAQDFLKANEGLYQGTFNELEVGVIITENGAEVAYCDDYDWFVVEPLSADSTQILEDTANSFVLGDIYEGEGIKSSFSIVDGNLYLKAEEIYADETIVSEAILKKVNKLQLKCSDNNDIKIKVK